MTKEKLDKLHIFFVYISIPIFIILTLLLKHVLIIFIPILLNGIIGLIRGRIYFKTIITGVYAYIYSIIFILIFLLFFIFWIFGIIPRW